MIVLQKMHVTSKIFGKFYLNSIKDTFFQYVVCNQRRDGKHKEKGRLNFLVEGDIWRRKEGIFEILGVSRSPPLHPLIGKPWSLHKENPEGCARSTYCNDFEKSDWGNFLAKQ